MSKTWHRREPRSVTEYPMGFKSKTYLGVDLKPGETTERDYSGTTYNGDRWMIDRIEESRHPVRRHRGSLRREYKGQWTTALPGGRRWVERDQKSDRTKGLKKSLKGVMKARLKERLHKELTEE